ncbi:response regulator transcription factor [Martelella alba]|uniref:Response regulator transcription factor n=1 Tax=Martelella alba TaxID=2590451 RepID=A0ABY2SPA2_9HYPH|nr:LuxR C-terminal-related transcriptional regulator [Martelella alba]TKI07827.1 response regulator transcription factor [Martelella alba]
MNHIVYVVDDDFAVRQSIVGLLRSEHYHVADFPSLSAFFARRAEPHPGCVILAMNRPAYLGFEIMTILAKIGRTLPVIIITGFGTIPFSVKAIKSGAHEFLTKPLESMPLLRAVREGLATAEKNLAFLHEQSRLAQRHQTLTPREREVMELAIGGLLNKQIAMALGVSEITAKVHKRRVMEKMQTRSLADLVRAAERLNIVKSQSR